MSFKPISVIATELGVSVDDIYCATCSFNKNTNCDNTGKSITDEWNNFCGCWKGDAIKLAQYHKGEI